MGFAGVFSLGIHFLTGGVGVWMLNATLGGQTEAPTLTAELVSPESLVSIERSSQTPADDREQVEDGVAEESPDEQPITPHIPDRTTSDSLLEKPQEVGAGTGRTDDHAQAMPQRKSQRAKAGPNRSGSNAQKQFAGEAAQDHPHVGAMPSAGLVTSQQTIVRPAVQKVSVQYRQVQPHYGWLADMVKRRMDRTKRYPRVARARGWQGKVVLQAAVGSSGRVRHVNVERSSGHDVLDEDAVNLMWQISPLPLRYPIEESEVFIEVPVKYELD